MAGGTAIGAAIGYQVGTATGVILAGACDVATDALCVPANPAIVVGTQGAFTAIGGYLGMQSSRLLASNMAKINISKNPSDATHHIVAENDLRAADSRAILANVGLDINSAFNGINIPALYHGRIHTAVYHDAVFARLKGATTYGGAAARLTSIRVEIAAGTFPF